MKKLQFTKMHGLGNDFVVIDGIGQSIDVKNLPIKALSDRHIGIGFDQLLLVLKSDKADFACKIFNADGSLAEQCGNGMRCIARFLHENKLCNNKSITIETAAGISKIGVEDYDHISVDMGIPQFETKNYKDTFSHLLAQSHFIFSVLSIGNPHAILQVSNLKNFPVKKMGKQISRHDLFPNGINVGFMEIINSKHIRLSTFERGVGKTLACGSNAVAAVASGIQNKILEHEVKVELTKGNLWVKWNDVKTGVILTGPAAHVFTGEW